jgi:hypothetical protein
VLPFGSINSLPVGLSARDLAVSTERSAGKPVFGLPGCPDRTGTCSPWAANRTRTWPGCPSPRLHVAVCSRLCAPSLSYRDTTTGGLLCPPNVPRCRHERPTPQRPSRLSTAGLHRPVLTVRSARGPFPLLHRHTRSVRTLSRRQNTWSSTIFQSTWLSTQFPSCPQSEASCAPDVHNLMHSTRMTDRATPTDLSNVTAQI